MKYRYTLCFCLFSLTFLSAQTIEWNGGTGNWNVPGNWDCNCLPNTDHYVIIDNGTVTIPAMFSVHVGGIDISPNSTLLNYDTLTVDELSFTGLRVDGLFENYGKLEFMNADGTALQIFGSTINHGSIIIDSLDVVNISVEEFGSFTNHGLIDIVSYYNQFGMIVEQNAGIHNTVTGIINLRNGYPFASAIALNGHLTNDGNITTYRGSIDGLGSVVNTGSLHMDNPESDPQQGFTARRLYNMSTGLLTVNQTSSFGFVFLDSLVNQGTIRISNTFTDAMNLNGTYCVNTGEISIAYSGRYGITTGVESTLRNESTGSMYIRHCLAGALRIERIQLYNAGEIQIDTVGSNVSASTDHGIDCVLSGLFFNDTTGLIEIDSCYASGLNLATALTSENHGVITVRNARQNGMILASNHDLINTGTFDVDHIQGVGIVLSGATTSLINSGTIRIGPNMDITDFSINNSSTFINDACGFVSTVTKLRNTSSFINHGFLKNASTTTHTFTGGGTLNTGVLEDYNGFYTAHANADNEGIILNSRISGGCPGYVLTNALTLGDLSGFNILGVFQDSDATIPIGTYDSISNSVTQLNVFASNADWYWVIQDSAMLCQDTLRMRIMVTCPISCVVENDNYWTSCADNSDWFDAENWTTGIPSIDHTVFISPISTKPDPILNLSTQVKSIELFPGASLTITNGNLTLQD